MAVNNGVINQCGISPKKQSGQFDVPDKNKQSMIGPDSEQGFAPDHIVRFTVEQTRCLIRCETNVTGETDAFNLKSN